MIQSSYSFGGLPIEDPNEHILRFMEVCNTQKYNGVPGEALRLLLFSILFEWKSTSLAEFFTERFCDYMGRIDDKISEQILSTLKSV